MVRFKNRYIVCEIICDGQKPNFNEYEFYANLKVAVTKYHGDYGTGCIMTSLSVKHFNMNTGIVIIRVKRECCWMIQSTLTFITSIKNIQVTLHTVHIGGTLKSCQRFLIKFHQKQLAISLRQCKTKEERIAVRQLIKRSDNSLKKTKKSTGILDDINSTDKIT